MAHVSLYDGMAGDPQELGSAGLFPAERSVELGADDFLRMPDKNGCHAGYFRRMPLGGENPKDVYIEDIKTKSVLRVQARFWRSAAFVNISWVEGHKLFFEQEGPRDHSQDEALAGIIAGKKYLIDVDRREVVYILPFINTTAP